MSLSLFVYKWGKPAKDCGCACPHGEGSPDAAAFLTPSRERERERPGCALAFRAVRLRQPNAPF